MAVHWPGPHNPAVKTPLQHIVEVVDWMADRLYREILPRLERIEKGQLDMTQAMDSFKVQLKAYTDKVDAYVAAAEANQTNSDALVAAAVAKAEADEDVDVGALATALAAEADKVPVAPTPPAPPPPPDQPVV